MKNPKPLARQPFSNHDKYPLVKYLPSASVVNKTTIYVLTTNPRVRAGAISLRYSGAITVKAPEPRPPKMRAKRVRLYIPEEKI